MEAACFKHKWLWGLVGSWVPARELVWRQMSIISCQQSPQHPILHRENGPLPPHKPLWQPQAAAPPALNHHPLCPPSPRAAGGWLLALLGSTGVEAGLGIATVGVLTLRVGNGLPLCSSQKASPKPLLPIPLVFTHSPQPLCGCSGQCGYIMSSQPHDTELQLGGQRTYSVAFPQSGGAAWCWSSAPATGAENGAEQKCGDWLECFHLQES